MKVKNADIAWLDSGLPYSTRYDDVYYSEGDELAESQHVFIQANRLRERWEAEPGGAAFHIGELGFGSGLNFLQAMRLWQETQARPGRLHYIAFEKHPLTAAQLERIHQRWVTLLPQSSELREQYTDHSAGCHRLQFGAGITLDLYFGDAHEQLSARMAEACPPIQCWFLDGFSPANNSDLWEESLMALLADCSEAGTTLSSYSVAGRVRSALQQSGFEVHKVEGFGRKRHSLVAQFPPQETASRTTADSAAMKTPWFILPKSNYSGRSAAVIGAGLAGCSTAHSLAQRGWQVSIYDSADGPASGASGNAALALRCRLFNAESAQAAFFLHAYLFALRQFGVLRRQNGLAWNPCSLLQLRGAMNKRRPLESAKLERLYSEQVVTALSRESASQKANVELSEAAWHFPGGGAMDPVSLCNTYLSHPNIHCNFATSIREIERGDGHWHLLGDGIAATQNEVVVIANSHGAASLAPALDLPLQVLRGQTTEVTSNGPGSDLRCVVSGGRTVFPVVEGSQLLSASYSDGTHTDAVSEDSEANRAQAAQSFAEDVFVDEQAVAERVSFRCNTPDRFPVVGMLPDAEAMRAGYADLSRNARARFSRTGVYHSGAYINVAHGSNGLASCPLSAEFLASQICGENLPLSRGIVHALSPARFLIGDLKKQRG